MTSLRRIEPRPDPPQRHHRADPPQRLVLVPVQSLPMTSSMPRIFIPSSPQTFILQSNNRPPSTISTSSSNSSIHEAMSPRFTTHSTHDAGPSNSNGNDQRSFPQRRDILKRKIEQRPSRQKLVTQHILLSASSADPLIQQKAQLLKKCRIVSNLNRKLKHRPGPLELVTRKILQVDAELEQAIQEGRVLFKPTGGIDELGEERVEQEFHPISPDMEVVSAVSNSQANTNNTSSKSKVRKKVTPYRGPTTPVTVPQKSKTKTPQSSDSPSYMQGNEEVNGETSSYDLLLQQQQLLLDWQQSEEKRSTKDAFGEVFSDDSNSMGIHQTIDYQGSIEQQQLCDTKDTLHYTLHQPASTPIMGDHDCQQGGCSCAGEVNGGNDFKRLSDYRVQDLKQECKKRQLPVSGAKPQLLERLRPYEKTILSSSNEGGPSTPPTSPPEQQNSNSIQYNVLCQPNTPSMCSSTQPVREQTRETIHDFLQKNAPRQQNTQIQQQQSQQQQQIVMHVASPKMPQQQQQLVKLVDQNGVVLGMATVASLQGIQGGMISLPTISHSNQIQSNMQTTVVQSQPQQQQIITSNGTVCCVQEMPTHNGRLISAPSTPLANNGNKQSHTLVQPVIQMTKKHQMPNKVEEHHQQQQPTFRFAQLGSGGQFTIVQSSDQTPANTDTNYTMLQVAPMQNQMVTTGPTVVTSSGVNLSGANFVSTSMGNTLQVTNQNGMPIQTQYVQVQQGSHAQEIISVPYTESTQSHCIQQSNASYSSPTPPMTTQLVQMAYIDSEGKVRRVCQSGSPVTADAAASSPNMPPPSVHDIPPHAKRSFTIDPNDPSSLASTLHLHEEMLKFQQKKIEEMQRELVRSQHQLRNQQQLISAAKKQQAQSRDGTSARQSQAEHWLSQIDVRQLNKVHIQHFIQHKLQQQQLQHHVTEQNDLVQTEAKMQEELHVEQAVQDIVRLIKQDARTALLIVQLLRKYQLERQAELQAQQVKDQQEQHSAQDQAGDVEEIPQQTYHQQSEDVQIISGQIENVHNAHNAPVNWQPMQKSDERAHSASPQIIKMVVRNEANGMENQGMMQQTLQCGQTITVNQRRASNPEMMTHPKTDHEVQIISDDECSYASQPKNKVQKRRLTEKQIVIQKPDCTANVDMEEIFKTVLEDASRALRNDDIGPYSDGAATTAYGTPESMHNVEYIEQPHEDIALDVACDQNHLDQMAVETVLGSHPHVENHQSLVVMHHDNGDDVAMDECSRETMEILDSGNSHYADNFFSNNQEFDDLMDVLRDDQDSAQKTNTMIDFGLNYGQDELAQLIGDDWLESADQSLQQSSSGYLDSAEQNPPSCASQCLTDPILSAHTMSQDDHEQQNMDWLDMMLQNAPVDESLECLRTPTFYQRNQMDAPC